MADRGRWHLDNGCTVHTVFSDTDDGDLSIRCDPRELVARRRSLAPGEWTWLHQVHGATTVVVGSPGECAGDEADAAVSAVAGAVLGVQVADCAPVLLWAPLDEGAAVAAVHAGWRGLLRGVLPSALKRLGELGVLTSEIRWSIGPCIAPSAYEFSGPELSQLAEVFGASVVAETATGTAALDLRAAVASALGSGGVLRSPEGGSPPCTAASSMHWSHRAEGTASRQAGVIWWESPP